MFQLRQVSEANLSNFYNFTQIGAEVAAYVDDMWILAEVVNVYRAGKYEVKDIDEEQKAKYTVRRSRLIPLPRWRADPLRDSHALFPVNALVLALYPQTTCFYKVSVSIQLLRNVL